MQGSRRESDHQARDSLLKPFYISLVIRRLLPKQTGDRICTSYGITPLRFLREFVAQVESEALSLKILVVDCSLPKLHYLGFLLRNPTLCGKQLLPFIPPSKPIEHTGSAELRSAVIPLPSPAWVYYTVGGTCLSMGKSSLIGHRYEDCRRTALTQAYSGKEISAESAYSSFSNCFKRCCSQKATFLSH